MEYGYRLGVLVLLVTLVSLEIEQRRSLRSIDYSSRTSSEPAEVRVVNSASDPIPITGSWSYVAGMRLDNVIPVQVKNTGVGDAVPVRTWP